MKKNNSYPTQATPEQVGKLAERLERNAQMTGGKGPFTKIADNLGRKKPIIKKAATAKAVRIDIPLPTFDIERYKNGLRVEEPRQIIKPVPTKPYQVEDDPKYNNTIFGSDIFYRRKRGLDD